MPFTLDYGRWIPLDAEFLAETGIGQAYASLLPEFRKYVPRPAHIAEESDNDIPRYSVRCGTKQFVICSPELDDHGSWGRATFAFFTIINEQLASWSEYRFYAINGGNDLGGMFLTPAQASAAHKALPNKRDWPYLPTNEPPCYGQYH